MYISHFLHGKPDLQVVIALHGGSRHVKSPYDDRFIAGTFAPVKKSCKDKAMRYQQPCHIGEGFFHRKATHCHSN